MIASSTGLRFAPPSNGLYVWLFKLSSTHSVSIDINSSKVSSGTGGQSESPRCEESALIPMVSSNGTLLNRLLMPKSAEMFY